MNKAFTYFACFYFTDIFKGASSNAVMHYESTSYPSISAGSDLSERGVELASRSHISVPSVSGDGSHSVTTVRLPTNGQGLDQTQDSTGSPFEVVDNGSIECEPSDETSHITNL